MEKHVKLAMFRVNEMSFKINGTIKPGTAFKIVPKIENKIGVNGKNLFANLSVRINEDISSPVPFDLNVVMFGQFTIENEADQSVYARETLDVLYPFLRATVTTLTANCNIPPYVLPVISSDAAISDQNAQNAKEDLN